MNGGEDFRGRRCNIHFPQVHVCLIEHGEHLKQHTGAKEEGGNAELTAYTGKREKERERERERVILKFILHQVRF